MARRKGGNQEKKLPDCAATEGCTKTGEGRVFLGRGCQRKKVGDGGWGSRETGDGVDIVVSVDHMKKKKRSMVVRLGLEARQNLRREGRRDIRFVMRLATFKKDLGF
jgi:hypothetical protein